MDRRKKTAKRRSGKSETSSSRIKKVASKKKTLSKKKTIKQQDSNKSASKQQPAIHHDPPHRPAASRLHVINAARKLISRSKWHHYHQDRLNRICLALLKKLQDVCPSLAIDNPLKPGEVLGNIDLPSKEFKSIVASAANPDDESKVVWVDGSNELLVDLAGVATSTSDGLITIKIPVFCEETGKQNVLVNFATGTANSSAGLIFATENLPEGPAEIVEIWGESLIALAWSSLQHALSSIADASGTDEDGAGLVPAALTATRQGVSVLVMARHEMDRIVK